jgi:hypothetical protein
MMITYSSVAGGDYPAPLLDPPYDEKWRRNFREGIRGAPNSG